ncbi:MAG: hypothetical protein H6876_06305 [Hyphomicrobiaceae bacterium]|nr:hypothetical protein [Hyphomicrobiaceae bacterium]
MATLAETGFYLKFKLKGIFEKDAITKSGTPYKKVSLRGIFYRKGPADEETSSVFISVPPGHKMPELSIDTVYSASVDVTAGNDRNLFVNLNTHIPLQSEDV